MYSLILTKCLVTYPYILQLEPHSIIKSTSLLNVYKLTKLLNYKYNYSFL